MSNLGRYFRHNEIMRMQGIPAGRLIIPDGMSQLQVGGMAGNSFSVPVVHHILARLLPAVGLAGVHDPMGMGYAIIQTDGVQQDSFSVEQA